MEVAAQQPELFAILVATALASFTVSARYDRRDHRQPPDQVSEALPSQHHLANHLVTEHQWQGVASGSGARPKAAIGGAKAAGEDLHDRLVPARLGQDQLAARERRPGGFEKVRLGPYLHGSNGLMLASAPPWSRRADAVAGSLLTGSL
jgi:hypothetical protein